MANECAIGDLLEVRVWTTAGDQAAVNVFHYGVNALGTGGFTDLNVAENLDTLMGPLYANILTATNTYNGTQCQIIHRQVPSAPLLAAHSIAAAAAGNVSGATMPRQVAYVMGWVTAKAGRKYRGRTYFPFPPVSFDTGEGVPTTPAIQAYDAIKTALLNYTTVDFAPGSQVELTLYHRGVPRGTPPIPWTDDPIIAGLSRAKWGTQRRRGSYGRLNASPF